MTASPLVKGRIDAAKLQNVVLLSATTEVELFDSQSGKCLTAVADLNAAYDNRTANAEDEASFANVVGRLAEWTRQLVARLDGGQAVG
jgi:hypothetical protein